jgi:HlyD family secretion protein
MGTMNKSGRRRAVIWSAGVLLIAAVIWVAFRPQPIPVDFGSVVRGDLQVTVDQEGKTRVHDRYVVSAPVAGRVLRVELEPGDPVQAGKTVVATFLPGAPPLLDARARAEAEAQIRAAEASVQQARATLGEARGRHELAASQLKRTQGLFDEKILAQADLDQAESTAKTASDAVDAAQAALATAQHQADAARAALVELGQATNTPAGRPITMRSPVDGVVLQRLHESEAVVPAGEPIVEIGNPVDLEVVADYLSTDAVKIRAGMPATIDRWGGDRPLKGQVRVVEPYGFVKVSALGVEEQRVNVIVALDDPRSLWAALGDGYRVEVRVILWEGASVLKVPTSALVRHGNGWAVFVAQGNRARLTPVTIGQQTGIEAQVLGGLTEGERVLVHPSDTVVDGSRIEPRT